MAALLIQNREFMFLFLAVILVLVQASAAGHLTVLDNGALRQQQMRAVLGATSEDLKPANFTAISQPPSNRGNGTHAALTAAVSEIEGRSKAEIIVVSILCGLLIMSMLGCLVAYLVKKTNGQLRMPAFLRRKWGSQDKFTKYNDNAFDHEGF